MLPDPMTHGLPVRGSRETLLETLGPLEGRWVADIGCGDGTMSRLLAGAGAHVIGLDPNGGQVERAWAAETVGDESYVQAGAEALPLATGGQDVALFFNSLHHVPVTLMATAVAEAARVTRPGGRVVAFEPVARGANFTLNRPVDDETEVRRRAYETLHAAVDQTVGGDAVLTLDDEFEYVTVTRKRDFESWRDAQIRISPARAARFQADPEGLRAHFHATLDGLPQGEDGAVLLDQPMRVTVLYRT